MYVTFTESEIQRRKALEEKYDALIAEIEAEIERLAPPGCPDTDSYFKDLDPKKNPEEWDAAVKRENDDIGAWIESGSPEWKAARHSHGVLMNERIDKRHELFKECEQRQFNELGGDQERIKQDFEKQVPLLIDAIYREEKDFLKDAAERGGGEVSSIYTIPLGGTRWKLNPEQVQKTLKNELHLHYAAVAGNDDLIQAFNNFIIDSMLKRPYIAQPGTEAKAQKIKVKPAEKDGFSTSGKRVKSVEYPIDKVNNNVWNLLSFDTAGQLTFNLDMASYQDRQKGKQVPLYYSINFSAITDITITKQLQPYDKRVYIAIAALYNQGNTVISYSQIYAAMGNKKRPSAKDIAKIDKSVTKMAEAWLTMNNNGEVKAKYKYKPWEYDAALLPLERMRSIINGVPVENAIHLFREPPLVTFAKERKQFTTFDIHVLDTPVSKTDQNIMIEDYLLDAIAAIGHNRRNSKVLFNTIYEAAKITTKMQRSRAPEKIVKVLEYYQECGLIKKYVLENDGINITV